MAYLASSPQGGRVPKEQVKLGYSATRYKKASQTPPPGERLSRPQHAWDALSRDLWGHGLLTLINSSIGFSSLFEISFLTSVWALPLLTA